MQVLQSAAGYYIGTECQCGPFSRETGYFREFDQAQNALLVYKQEGWLPLSRK